MYAARRAIGAYAQVGIETSVVDANPHRLIAMLFE
ncbi:flagellar protein FliS, partial [Agrobacterium sp. a22-2]|nr:flagellar protein FliS [Agrobacterium sp. a22-2]